MHSSEANQRVRNLRFREKSSLMKEKVGSVDCTLS